jgi:hypothetical protein
VPQTKEQKCKTAECRKENETLITSESKRNNWNLSVKGKLEGTR